MTNSTFKRLAALLTLLLPIAGCLFLFGRVILSQFENVPGNLGDVRFNNLLLEHNFRFMLSQSLGQYWDAFWLFFPHKNALAFSDNLAGSAFIYALWRILGFSELTSMQLWMIACSLLNFAAMFWLLRKMKFHSLAASLGAFIFAFSMPRGQQLGHPQTLPHFFTPLFLGMVLAYFRSEKPWPRRLSALAAAVCLSAQIWSAIYLGWFLVFGSCLLFCIGLSKKTHRTWITARLKQDWRLILSLSLLLGATLLPMALPYLNARAEIGPYGWGAVNRGLPSIAAYLFPTNGSFFYSKVFSYTNLKEISSLREQSEKRLFLGFALLFLPVVMIYLRRKTAFFREISLEKKLILRFALCLVILLVGLSLCFSHGISLWFIVYKIFPAANAIRAGARIILFLLVPMAILAALLTDTLIGKDAVRTKFLALGFCLLVLFENAHLTRFHFTKTAHGLRLQTLENQLTSQCDLFFYHGAGKTYEVHLDAMWVALKKGVPTLNGYSGHRPNNWHLEKTESVTRKEIDAWLKLYDLPKSEAELCLINGSSPS